MADLGINVKHFLLLLIVCFFSFFANNYFIPADLMESRNLATAQEMVARGNYMTPTMNGELRLEKPPLPTWIAAAINHVIPDNISAQRCAAGVAAVFLVFFLYLIVFEFSQKQTLALFASLVLATSYNVVMMGRTATWDIYCHSFMLGAIYFMVRAFNGKGAQWGYFIVSGLLMGLSFLSKGPVSFFALLLPFLISYFIFFRPDFEHKVLPFIGMIMICLAMSLWWPAYIYLFYKDWSTHIADKESSSWINHNVRSWYYYWQFAAESGIWAFFWITSLVWPYWKKRFEGDLRTKKIYLFSVLWTLSALVLLSLIPEKKTRYLLPMLIPGAFNISLCLFYFVRNKLKPKEEILFKVNISVILLVLISLPIALYIMFLRQGYLDIWLFVVITLLCLALAAAMYHYTFRSVNRRIGSIFCIVGIMMLVESLCFIPASKLFINNDRHSIRETRTISELQHLPFYYVETEGLRIELVYESNRIIRSLDIRNDSVVRSKLPFVLLSGLAPDSLFSGLSRVSVDVVGVYDNNWQKVGSKKYNKNLVRYVSIIKAR
ncbi:glycosyltransferase family 39 protein [uncultured Bacteroides sp.]|uniref:ArnT family glycosyltransferase n=1 Tax=uncultured Bacteroides sp. TaxID=162156 RepID=UPI002AA62020|nr:glycosyltransferase family 39 protein [uncultured Bacteroides sp.]